MITLRSVVRFHLAPPLTSTVAPDRCRGPGLHHIARQEVQTRLKVGTSGSELGIVTIDAFRAYRTRRLRIESRPFSAADSAQFLPSLRRPLRPPDVCSPRPRSPPGWRDSGRCGRDRTPSHMDLQPESGQDNYGPGILAAAPWRERKKVQDLAAIARLFGLLHALSGPPSDNRPRPI